MTSPSIRVVGLALALMLTGSCANQPAGESKAVAEDAQPSAELGSMTLTLTEGTNMSAAVSPDGTTIVASIQGALWSIPGAGGDAKALTAPELDAHEPAFSPDGKMVAFYAFAEDGFSVFTMAPDGSSLKKRAGGVGDARYPSFSPDGGRLLYSSDEGGGYSIVELDLASGAMKTVIAAADAGYKVPLDAYFQKAGNAVYPVLSPDGATLAFVIDGAPDMLVVTDARKPGAVRKLYEADTLGAPAWAASSDALYVVAIKGATSHLAMTPLAGAAKTVVSGGDIFPFRPSMTGDGRVMVTADGLIKTFAVTGGEAAVRPFRATVSFVRPSYKRKTYDFTDVSPQKALGIFDPSLSPDGSKAAFTAVGDLWLADLATGGVSKLTDDPAIDMSPAFSPDGKTVAFVSDRGGKSDIWTITLANQKLAQVTDLATPPFAPAYSPEGTRLAFLQDSRQSIFLAGTVEVLDLKTRKQTRVGESLFGPSQPAWSPTGKTVAVVARHPFTSRFREGHNALLLMPASGKGELKWVSPVEDVSLGRRQWNRPAWSSKGEIIYRVNGELWSNTLDDGGKLGAQPKLIASSGINPNWSEDGSRLIFLDGSALKLYDAKSNTTTAPNVSPSWHRALSDQSYTIRTARLFDGRADAYRANVEVVVERGVITDIRPAGSRPVTGTLIDAGDRAVIPGLIESHTHQSTSLGRKLGELWLSFGITSVRETGTDSYEAVERREAEAAGRRPGPRVFAAGPLNEGARVSYGISETVGTAEEAEEAVEQSTALGLDMLKSYVRQDYGVQKVIIAAAHKSGIPVSGHELYPAVANGVDQMEHVGGTSRRGFSLKISALEHSYQDVIELVAKSGLVITPTLALHSRNGERDIAPILATVGKIAREGGRIVAGTDSPFIDFATSLHTEMKLYVDAGLTPAQAIRAATYDGAVAIGADSEIGSIEIGKMADLVVIDGDPLATITDTRKVDMVMKSGAIVFEKK